MPLKSGGAVDNEHMRGRANQGLMSIGKVGPTKLYVGLNTTPAKVVKVDLKTFTRETSLSLGATEVFAPTIASYKGYLYVATGSGHLMKIKLSTFTIEATLSLSTSDVIMGSTLSDSFLYVTFAQPATPIDKVNLSTFTLVSTLNTGDGQAYCLVASGGFLYVGLRLTNKIVKVDLTTFTRVSSLTLSSGGYPHALVVVGGFLYVGDDFGNITKINLVTFTEVSTLALSISDVQALAVKGNYLYASGNEVNVNADISKIDLDSFTEVSVLAIAGVFVHSMVVVGDYLYEADQDDPSKINKIALSTFTLDSSVTLAVGEGNAESMVAST